MNKSIKLTKQGFTIVETLIVLAIAALIITIILIAVPDLQRTSRNTDIKNDATNIVSGVQSFESNNNGSVPTGVGAPAAGTGVIKFTGPSGTNPTTATVQANDNIAVPTAPAAVPTSISAGHLIVNLGENCNSNTSVPTGVAIYYPVETGSGVPNVNCIQG